MKIAKTAEQLVKGVDKLVSLPEVCFMVNDLVNDPNSDIEQIGNVISQDPDLTARLLKLVNSSYYGFETPVDTVSRAIMMVGLRDLQSMIWASSAVETFNHLPPSDANMAGFWRHSIFCAVTARILARECHVLHPERLFVAGLLHDIGRLLIFHKLPEKAHIVIQKEKSNPSADVAAIEREILGYDHAEVGRALCESWGLPEALAFSIGEHHDPSNDEKYRLECAILHVANIMAHALEMGEENNFQKGANQKAWDLLNLSEASIKRTLHEAVMQFLEALELLLPGASQRL
ncbi:MAG TPA: HDOD domain-containing protein [Gammaproteobacteria bacterium]|nr:HDOD domain-containing protein [Gammaproteobacteria bacterium]